MNAVAEAAAPPAVVERIAATVRDPAVTSDALQALFDEALELRRGMMDAESDCMKQSLDPANSVAEARAARESALDFAHEGKRLEAALASIDQVLPDIKAAEHQAAIMPAYLKYRDERSAFIDRLRDRWPKLTAEMVELLNEIERYRQVPAVEIPEGQDPLRRDVEMEAREIAGFNVGYTLISPLGDATIPALNPSGGGYAWTRHNKRTSTW